MDSMLSNFVFDKVVPLIVKSESTQAACIKEKYKEMF